MLKNEINLPEKGRKKLTRIICNDVSLFQVQIVFSVENTAKSVENLKLFIYRWDFFPIDTMGLFSILFQFLSRFVGILYLVFGMHFQKFIHLEFMYLEFIYIGLT